MKMKKICCLILAAALLFTAFPAAFGGNVLAAGSFHAVYQNDFSQSLNVTLSDPYLTFVQGENFGAAEGKLTGSKDVWSALSYNTVLAPAYAVSCDVSVGAIGGADITQSLVLGVRQSSPNHCFYRNRRRRKPSRALRLYKRQPNLHSRGRTPV